jgi:hypothetical protein
VIAVFEVLRLFNRFLAHPDKLSEVILIHLQRIPVEGLHICQVKHGLKVEHLFDIKEHINEPVLPRLPIFELRIQIQIVICLVNQWMEHWGYKPHLWFLVRVEQREFYYKLEDASCIETLLYEIHAMPY